MNRPRIFSPQHASALVVVLSLVVIVSLILATFVAMMQMDRLASASYSQSLAAEQIGQGALNRVVVELQNEMSADAPPDTVSGRSIYTNVSAANLLPQRFGTNSLMPSLMRTSVDDAFTNAAGVPVGNLRASPVGTGVPSFNRRYLDTDRWNAPCFGSFPDNASLPHWILVTRNGTTNVGTFGATGNTLNNAASDNSNCAIGRFAYAVYQVGGLLDATVAGYPSSLGVSQVNQLKGTLAGADLSAVGITDANAFVTWRNAASAANANSYLNYVTNTAAMSGFRKVAPGDTAFLGRQDLIRAAKSGIFDTNALPHLTVFTREKNAPSWRPTGDAPVAGFAYQTQANEATSVNRFIPLVRFPSAATLTSYRAGGVPFTYPVRAGDSLVQRRFFLGRLNWLGPNGPQNGGTAANIMACFGLQWNSTNNAWNYVGSTGSATLQGSMETLAQIANEIPEREPNFFELLQAGILTGSLGLSSDPGANGPVAGAPTIHQASSMLQILRIGAAIIDQYDADSYPTVIEYTEASVSPAAIWQAVGVEDLPYLNSFRTVVGTSPDTPPAAPTALAIYYTFGLWNPHQTMTLPMARPNLRIRIQGDVSVGTGYGQGIPVPLNALFKGYTASLSGTIQLSPTGASAFHHPGLLDSGQVSPSPGGGSSSGNAWVQTPVLNGSGGGLTAVAFRLPDLPFNMAATPPSSPLLTVYNSIYMRFQNPFQASLEYQSPTGKWIPYSYLSGVNDPRTWISGTGTDIGVWFGRSGGTPAECLDAAKFGAGFHNYASQRLTTIGPGVNPTISPPIAAGFYFLNPIRMAIDPRSLRFTLFQVGGTGALPNITQGGYSPFWAATMPDPAYQPNGYGYDSSLSGIPLSKVPPLFSAVNPNYFPAMLSRNNTNNTGKSTSYKDRDGMLRIGDSGLFPSSTDAASGNPHGRDADRPLVLNRPFQSVAELGYVSRDDPWRSLDFFSINSPDSPLLDLFTLTESEDGMVAGRIDLNSQDTQALEAVLRGVLPDITATGNVLSNPETIAASLSGSTKSHPLLHKSNLVSHFVGRTDLYPAATDESRIKTRREAVTRALADAGQTRTWNLMIDLFAQAGKYPPGATSMEQFVVEGERRYWLHVALDRFTGEVVDQQLEQVIE